MKHAKLLGFPIYSNTFLWFCWDVWTHQRTGFPLRSHPQEIIVVDDGSDPPLEELFQKDEKRLDQEHMSGENPYVSGQNFREYPSKIWPKIWY